MVSVSKNVSPLDIPTVNFTTTLLSLMVLLKLEEVRVAEPFWNKTANQPRNASIARALTVYVLLLVPDMIASYPSNEGSLLSKFVLLRVGCMTFSIRVPFTTTDDIVSIHAWTS
jgi:hypothetical protein